ncbi:hypothetical protein JCM10212_005769 [Sporobolomyces blumeae]
MGSPPIPDRSPPRPHPGPRPVVAPSSVPFSPPKRKSGGSIKGKERSMDLGGAAQQNGSPGDVPAQMAQGAQGVGLVTYRHLLGSNNLGAANPLRVIAHVDIDAAYAAMEMVRLQLPEDEPMATQQWNGLIAVNYPARAYGITRHESPAEALKKCPHLRLVHVQTYRNGDTEPGYWEDPPPSPHTHKVSLDMYRKESRKILSVFSEFCPIVEKASIDESFLDLTSTVRTHLLERYPALRTPPADSDLGLDTPLPLPKDLGIETIEWEGNVVPKEGQKKEKLKRLDSNGNEVPPSSSPVKPDDQPRASSSSLEANDDAGVRRSSLEPSTEPSGEPDLTWSDLALSIGAELVQTIRSETRKRLGYTCSAGIAPNKMLAKLCSAWKKPNAQTILRHCAVPNFLKPMPFQKIRNLGGKLGNAVKETYEAETVEDLQKYSLEELQSKLGDDSGVWLWEVCRGLDFTEVETKTQFKSMLSSKNFRPYITKYSEVIHWLNILATELHLRLTEAREDSPGLWPKTITFTHRSPQFVIRSHQAAFPFTQHFTIQYIFRQAEKLLRIALGTEKGQTGTVHGETKIGPYGNIQLSFSGLERLEEGQKGIERFFAAKGPSNAPPDKTSDTVRTTRDDDATGKRTADADGDDASDRRGGDERDAKKRKLAPSRSATPAIVVPSRSPSPSAAPTRPTLPTYTCPRCSRTLEIPSSALAAIVAADYSAESVEVALKKVEEEELDYHLARDLVEDERKRAGWRTTSSTSGGSSKSKSKAGSRSSDKVKGKGTKKTKDAASPAEGGQTKLGSFFRK